MLSKDGYLKGTLSPEMASYYTHSMRNKFAEVKWGKWLLNIINDALETFAINYKLTLVRSAHNSQTQSQTLLRSRSALNRLANSDCIEGSTFRVDVVQGNALIIMDAVLSSPIVK